MIFFFIYYNTQEVAKNPVMPAEFVSWLPLFFSSAFVPQLVTLSLLEVPLLSSFNDTVSHPHY
jgi:hypothetical protein